MTRLPLRLDMSSDSNSTGREAQYDAYQQTAQRCRLLLRERHTEHGLTVEQAAAALFVSIRGLQRALAYCGSEGFRAELTCVRAQEAARLFNEDPSLPINEAARRVGYVHATHFARGFRSYHGLSPSAFRQRARDERRRRVEEISLSFPAELLAAR